MPLETRGAFELAVMELGFPEIPDAQTPEEEALVMLHIAAELEHALLSSIYMQLGLWAQIPVT